MNVHMKKLARGLCVSALLCLAHAAGAIENARQYAGLYEISDVIKSGGSVQLTMKFTLLNSSNKTVNDGFITVLGSTPVPEKIAKFGVIETLPRIGRVKVTETFSVSAAEYARWERGNLPHFEFTVPGADGSTKADIQARRVSNTAGENGT